MPTLLREPLKKASKIGISKVVSNRRQYPAAVKPQDQLLVLELMHFADELIDTGQLKVAERDVGKKDLQKAAALIDNMSGKEDPEKYRDKYGEALEQVIDEKIEHPEKDLPKKAAPKRSPKVIGLVAVLQKSLSKARETRAPQEGGIAPE